MGFRVISNDEVVKALPTQKEMGKFEQLIRRNPVSIPNPTSIVTKMLTKNPAPAPIPVPKSIFLKPESITKTVVLPESVPEPVPEIELDEMGLAEIESVIEPEYIPEPLPKVPPPPPSKPQPTTKKSSFDLPLGREHYSSEFHGRGNYIPVHIPPAVTEPLVIPDEIKRTEIKKTTPISTDLDTDAWETPVLPHHPKPVVKPVVKPIAEPVIAPVSIPANIIAERVPIIPERVHEYPDSASIYGGTTTAPARTTFQDTPSHLSKFNFSPGSGLITMFFIVRIVLGIAMVGFGIYTSGSYYGSAITKYSGDMAMLFYRYQLGMILAFAGMILVYDALRFRIRK
jgi:hypothetical protein